MGANLELFKFATYLAIPLFCMLHFGDPQWYEHHVYPYKEMLWPKYEETNKPPKTAPELHAELARLKEERLRARAGLPPISPSERAAAASSAESAVLAGVPEGKFGWAEGDKRWV